VRYAFLAAIFLLFACHEEQTGVVAGPPLRIGVSDAAPPLPVARTPSPSSPAAPVDAAPPAPAEEFCPVNASFVALGAETSVTHVACETRVLFVVEGSVEASGEEKAGKWKQALGVGDVLVTQGKGGYRVRPSRSGKDAVAPRAVLAILQPSNCEPNQFTSLSRRPILGKSTKDLSWAGGAMHARTYLEGPAAAVASVGWLEGTAPVAEHAHEGAWEVLCVVSAAGTMTIAGKPERLAGGTCVRVPAGVKHAWAPDPGTTLAAVQFYSPPGPEQRFKALAGEVRDGGK
jgi:mannose-6-phosphate isomerase-like protein (cupin superfamily)